MSNPFVKIKDHPLVIMISCVIATASIIYGVVGYFFSEKLKIIESRYALRAQSIDRGIPGKNLFDVGQILIRKGEQASPSIQNSGLMEFPKDKFFAPKPAPDWKYESKSEYKYLGEILDAKKLSIQDTGLQIHLWRNDKFKSLKGVGIYNQIFPHIAVERVSLDKLRALLLMQTKGYASRKKKTFDAIKKALEQKDISLKTAKQRMIRALGEEADSVEGKNILKELEAYYDPAGQPDFNEAASTLDSMFSGDTVALFFLKLFSADVGINSPPHTPNGQFELLRVQKKQNVLYMKSRSRIKVISENGVEKDIAMYKETILLTTYNDLYSINIYLPTTSMFPVGSKDWKYTQAWLENFRVLE
jgi:hypothetical protein